MASGFIAGSAPVGFAIWQVALRTRRIEADLPHQRQEKNSGRTDGQRPDACICFSPKAATATRRRRVYFLISMVAQPARAVASLHHHVHGRQHASRGLQWDGWNGFVAGRATGSVDDQVGDATCGHEVG